MKHTRGQYLKTHVISDNSHEGEPTPLKQTQDHATHMIARLYNINSTMTRQSKRTKH
jgi:hypothetical protein